MVISRFVTVCAFVLFSSLTLSAGITGFSNKLQGTGIVNAAEIKTEDDRYVYMNTLPGSAVWSTEFVNYQVDNIVRLRYSETARTHYTTGWTVTVPLKLEKWSATGSPLSTESFTLQITYDPAAGVTYDDVSQFTTTDPGHRTKLSVNGTVTSTAPGGTVPADVILEGIIQVERYYYFDYTAVPDVGHFYNPTDNTLTFYWEYLPGAEEYDLEWAFVSAYDAVTMPNYDRAIRVSLNEQRYTINLPFDDGEIYYRVRGAGVHEDDWKSRLNGAWGFCFAPYAVTNLDGGKNWSYSAVYAEDGKRKEVVSFFDGSLRQRQAVTINSTDNVAMQTESFYDYEGRAVLQTLPAPDANFGSRLQFYTVQSVSENTNAQYNRIDFDRDDLFANCTMGTPAKMLATSGAAHYYSPSNAHVAVGFNAAIPDAGQYPFTQVAYDSEGRVKKQSAAGEDFVMGEGHEAQYFYANPSQERLDRLFGVEAGDAEHYSLRAAQDANGQVSLAYFDMNGRVIATSLAGETPDQLNAVQGNTLQDFKQDFSAQNYYDPLQEGWIINTSLLVTNPGSDYDFTYELTPQQYQSLCNNSVSGDCVYDLQIRIYDACNVPINSTGEISLPYAQTQVGPGGIQYEFTVQFPAVGTYRIEKRLSLSQAALDAAVADFIAALEESECVPSESSFQADLLAQYTFDCNDCQTWCEQQADAEGLTGTPRTDYIADCMAEHCQHEFHPTDMGCNTMLEVLKQDMKPNGQYYEASNWLYDNLEYTPASYGALFSWSGFNSYVLAICGYDPALSDWNEVDATWDDCYAGYLVQFHPEYCQYEWCVTMEPSTQYDMEMFGDGTSDDATTLAWAENTVIRTTPFYFIDLTPPPGISVGQKILDNDPFFQGAGSAYLSGTDEMQEELDDYQNSTLSMWDYAQTLTSCTTACDEQWQTFRALYIGTKQRFVKAAREAGGCYSLYDAESPPDNIANNTLCDYMFDFPPNCNPEGTPGFVIRWPDYSYHLEQINTTAEAEVLIEDMRDQYRPCRTAATLTVTLGDGVYELVEGKCITLQIDDGIAVTELMAAPICGPGTYSAEEIVQMIVLAINSYVSSPVDYTAAVNPLDPFSYIIYAPAALGAEPNGAYVQDDDFPKPFSPGYSNGGAMDGGDDSGPCPENIHCLCGKILQLEQMWDATYVDPTDLTTYNYIDHSVYSNNFNAYVFDMLNNTDPSIDQGMVDNWILNCEYSEGASPVFDAHEDESNTEEELTSLLDCENHEPDCDEDAPELTGFWGIYLHQQAVQQAVADFILEYKTQCWNYGNMIDVLRVEYEEREYHYTLYYYDQAGNLTRTVPPAAVTPLVLGATHLLGPNTIAEEIADYRNGVPGADFVVPDHSPLTLYGGSEYLLATYYQYNSLNQIEQSTSPDGGTTYFFYDQIGRIIASQNANQNSMSTGGFYFYSYMRYDAQGRVIESGQVRKTTALTPGTPMAYASFEAWLTSSSTRTEVTEMYYDVPLDGTGGTIDALFPNGQEHLRKRVATTTYEHAWDNDPESYDHASHYSYDVHGYVNALVQETPELNDLGQRYKYLTYEYDLVSGNVNDVHYQSGAPDQMHHHYMYDADNRLTNVYTSTYSVENSAANPTTLQGIGPYDQDAKYFYFLHGPRARTEIGDDKIQGLDYAYTINGWIKGVNSNILSEDSDLGKDGTGTGNNAYIASRTGLHSNVAKDVFGYVLGYYWDDGGMTDWEPINTAAQSLYSDADALSDGADDLYNGNISDMSTALMRPNASANPTAMPVIFNSYHYDQLNRILSATSYTHASNTTTYAANSSSAGEYYNTFSYDPNGNILTQLRNGTVTSGVSMDDLGYHYYANTNQLEYVTDGGTSGNYADDLETQSIANYGYTPNGELAWDASEDITQILWDINGKIHSITRDPLSGKPELEFKYDAMGNRICKIEKPTDGSDRETEHTWKYTYYVRDATGNVMAVYTRNKDENLTQYIDEFQLKETHIYGGSRLGIKDREQENITATVTYEFNGYYTMYPGTDGYNSFEVGDELSHNHPPTSNTQDYTRTRGRKVYELSNHLGNVLVTFYDRKLSVDNNANNAADYYLADVASASDYSAFGAPMPGRCFSNDDYRYGFNGKEDDRESVGTGSGLQDYGMRIYNSSLGRFLSVDPLMANYPWYTPFQFAGNRPVDCVDLDGAEPESAVDQWSPDYYQTCEDGTVVKMIDGFWVCEVITWASTETIQYMYYEYETGTWEIFHPAEHAVHKPFQYSLTSEQVHETLDLLGLVPVVGEIFDGWNSGIYLMEGDLFNASLSAACAVPILGWGVAGFKTIRRAIKVANGGYTALTWTRKIINGLIDFGSRSQLGKILGSKKGINQAHHVVPWVSRENAIVQKAAESGFHMNDPINGILLPLTVHNGSHPTYTKFVNSMLTDAEYTSWINKMGLGDTPESAKRYLEEYVIPEAKKAIDMNVPLK